MEFLRKRESRSFIGNCTLRLCARDLAEELIKRELCKVDRAVDYFKAYTYLKVSVTVIPPERSEKNESDNSMATLCEFDR